MPYGSHALSVPPQLRVFFKFMVRDSGPLSCPKGGRVRI